MTTHRRMPKRGFSNARFERRFVVVNVGELDAAFESGARVTPQAMLEAGIIRTLAMPVKVLGDGVLSKTLSVEAAGFSRSAMEKIKAAGGEGRAVS